MNSIKKAIKVIADTYKVKRKKPITTEMPETHLDIKKKLKKAPVKEMPQMDFSGTEPEQKQLDDMINSMLGLL